MFDREEWLKHYRTDKSGVWLKLMFGEENVFCNITNDYEQWIDVCNSRNLQDLTKIALQFRSNEIELPLTKCDGLYLIRSAKGAPGVPTSHYITFGRVVGELVSKSMYTSPELILEMEYTDSLDCCNTEAILNG